MPLSQEIAPQIAELLDFTADQKKQLFEADDHDGSDFATPLGSSRDFFNALSSLQSRVQDAGAPLLAKFPLSSFFAPASKEPSSSSERSGSNNGSG